MNNDSLPKRLAVCSWSLRPANLQDLIAQLQALGIHRVQLALDPLREHGGVWSNTVPLMQQSGIQIVSGMFGCVGEDYSTLETIRTTGGITPDGTWEENWNKIHVTAELARKLGLKLVTFHAGFLPHDENDVDFPKLQRRLKQVADLFADSGIALALETGQETAVTLRDFLLKLNRPNVGVNFDPANMILYRKGNPIEALRVLGPWIRQVHIKDALRPKVSGTWGEEVPVGTGEVDWAAFFTALREMNFIGDCCIEREAGEQRMEDIRTARQFIERISQ